MGPSDSPSEPLGALGRFMARAGCGVSVLRFLELVVGPRPGPAPPPEPTPPFPRALACTAARGAPAPPRPRGDAPPNRGKALGGHRPHRPLGGPAPLHRRCLDWRAGWPWAGALGGPTGEAQTPDLSLVMCDRLRSAMPQLWQGQTCIFLLHVVQDGQIGLERLLGVPVTSWTVIPQPFLP